MTDDQIKILSELERKYSRYPHPEDLRYKKALTAAIDYIRDTSEMLEAAVSVGFQSHFLTRISQETWVMHSDGSSNGIQFDSALSAWREVKKEGQKK